MKSLINNELITVVPDFIGAKFDLLPIQRSGEFIFFFSACYYCKSIGIDRVMFIFMAVDSNFLRKVMLFLDIITKMMNLNLKCCLNRHATGLWWLQQIYPFNLQYLMTKKLFVCWVCACVLAFTFLRSRSIGSEQRIRHNFYGCHRRRTLCRTHFSESTMKMKFKFMRILLHIYGERNCAMSEKDGVFSSCLFLNEIFSNKTRNAAL